MEIYKDRQKFSSVESYRRTLLAQEALKEELERLERGCTNYQEWELDIGEAMKRDSIDPEEYFEFFCEQPYLPGFGPLE